MMGNGGHCIRHARLFEVIERFGGNADQRHVNIGIHRTKESCVEPRLLTCAWDALFSPPVGVNVDHHNSISLNTVHVSSPCVLRTGEDHANPLIAGLTWSFPELGEGN